MVKVALAVCLSLVLSMALAVGAGILMGTDKRTGVVQGARVLGYSMTLCMAVVAVFVMVAQE